jgi:YggT family protein
LGSGQINGGTLIYFISLFFDILTWVVIAHVLMSYFLSPYHPAREVVDRLVEPMLRPIRRYVPPIGGLDFSSFFLIILLQLLSALFVGIFRTI